MKHKREYIVNVYEQDDWEDVVLSIEGRLLGFITEKEFKVILGHNSLKNKLFTIPSLKSIDDLVHSSIEGLRVILTTKTINQIPIVHKALFISDLIVELEYKSSDGIWSSATKNGKYMEVMEK